MDCLVLPEERKGKERTRKTQGEVEVEDESSRFTLHNSKVNLVVQLDIS